MAQILGVMACIWNLRKARMTGGDESLQIFNEFLCPECDKAKADSKITFLSKQDSGNCETMKPALLIDQAVIRRFQNTGTACASKSNRWTNLT